MSIFMIYHLGQMSYNITNACGPINFGHTPASLIYSTPLMSNTICFYNIVMTIMALECGQFGGHIKMQAQRVALPR